MTSSIPPSADPGGATPSDRLWLRSELMGTQVITRDSGRRLGVVGEVVVDIDRREVVALGLRDNPLTRFLPGLPRWMPLERICQVGDVILVESTDSLAEGFNPDRYSKVINCQVVTEAGAQLGRVLGFSFDIETGELTTLVIAALGVPLLGEGVLSTWEMPVGEIVSSGSDRIIVYEGAEEKLKQLGTGLLEKLGIGGQGWEQEDRDRYRSGLVPAENQLPAGQATAVEQRRIQPAVERSFAPAEELEYVELEERREREPQRQRRYFSEEPEPRPADRRAFDPRDGNDRAFDQRDRDSRDFNSRDRDSRDRDQPDRDRWDVDRGAFERPDRDRRDVDSRDFDSRDFESRDPERWDRDRRDPDRQDFDGPESGRPESGRPEPGRRDQSSAPADLWQRERGPSEGPPRSPERPPLRAEPRGSRSAADQPVDVEPEVLDDPW